MRLRTALCLLALSAFAFATGVQEASRPAPPVMETQSPPTKAKKPSAPKKKGAHSVELNWKPSPTKGVGYYVYRAEGGPNGNFVPLTPKPLHRTTFKDTKVKAGKTYAYAVSAVQKVGKKVLESERTPPVTAVIPTP